MNVGKQEKKIELFGISFDALTMKETVALVNEKLKNKEPTHVLGINADKVNELSHKGQFNQIIRRANIINADGASIILASKILRKPLPERIAGIDLMQELLLLAEKKNYRVYFLGAKQTIVTTMNTCLKAKYPVLNVAGYRNGYFKKENWDEVANELKLCEPDIVFIGITSPLKEQLIDYFLEQNINSVYMGVGGSFDVLSGAIKRAPIWMQKYQLEWLYRVYQEPKRLFRRYLFGNSKFIVHVLQELFR
ncbi:WecB/TagA/CpsF family glycosyltransferase [Enterococcus phoeniculicola]|uniref:WecB/TagA/CpsF family glycosyltransferase n=1 Tax=Enterococcus phoeniculicola ATCC BAA-412 TaxID=1158610 RepID=R3WMD8_9ENTE|nr:WecB/TagA/CpsF family glycosyltransferase [Enterococcus phoeniculicola]EOL42985.1 WecB/TagA/CpsF family glycosyltransferase [Enterococcus phoeniculicola ATCC BAA-412]EOT76657.1 hypothetical protein I589_01614 [Enterococcus phoeniculicola ATCC BAA-412]OJG72225.1 WecB/TagA/CpsF family glycosyltransferase [Enterococcus phoeniculicola]